MMPEFLLKDEIDKDRKKEVYLSYIVTGYIPKILMDCKITILKYGGFTVM
ncbi:hypothetical protein [Muricomes intestini]|jgi:hypothetical protein